MIQRTRLACAVLEGDMPTSAAPRGVERGYVNRLMSMGLPPWAAFGGALSRRTTYKMCNPHPGVYPTHPHKLKEIWMYERIRCRVQSSRSLGHSFKKLKHPGMEIGVWFSDILDHWVQIPHVPQARYAIEKAGGIDNFILNTPGGELKSIYGERLRRHLLVRKGEIEKNFILEKTAQALAREMFHAWEVDPGSLAAYGISAEEVPNGDGAETVWCGK
ncbi:39S ribosomal protein L28 mitochondrial [Perkinsela sp. CCAP 1560/4]|nr:39S ribosomal protein L28 mitochondrial [Perkinsela sp. CCAP 1560/4]|eukprot:KNH09269.1 39S ribosomal protein L28 mitochondrial [Perkinsela sp. CCAP 1560/4]